MTARTAAPTLPPPIATLLRHTARRLRLRAACFGAVYGLAAGLALGVLLGILARVRPLFFMTQTLEWGLGALGVGVALGAFIGAVRPLSRTAVAARADADLGLRERVVTALELVSGAAPDLQLNTQTSGGRTTVSVDARDSSGAFRNGLTVVGTIVGPDGARPDVTLRQTAPGRYQTDLGTLPEGSHLLAIVAKDGDGTAQAATSGGLIIPCSPEYALPRTDRTAILARARELTGGAELADAAAAFAHTLPHAQQARAIWSAFLILATLLLPFDIAIRRLLIGRSDFARVFARAGVAFRRRPAPVVAERGASNATLGGLLAARQQQQERWDRAGVALPPPPTSPTPSRTVASPTAPAVAPRPTAPTAAPPHPIPASQFPVPRAPLAPPQAPSPQRGESGTLGELLRAKEAAHKRRE